MASSSGQIQTKTSEVHIAVSWVLPSRDDETPERDQHRICSEAHISLSIPTGTNNCHPCSMGPPYTISCPTFTPGFKNEMEGGTWSNSSSLRVTPVSQSLLLGIHFVSKEYNHRRQTMALL